MKNYIILVLSLLSIGVYAQNCDIPSDPMLYENIQAEYGGCDFTFCEAVVQSEDEYCYTITNWHLHNGTPFPLTTIKVKGVVVEVENPNNEYLWVQTGQVIQNAFLNAIDGQILGTESIDVTPLNSTSTSFDICMSGDLNGQAHWFEEMLLFEENEEIRRQNPELSEESVCLYENEDVINDPSWLEDDTEPENVILFTTEDGRITTDDILDNYIDTDEAPGPSQNQAGHILNMMAATGALSGSGCFDCSEIFDQGQQLIDQINYIFDNPEGNVDIQAQLDELSNSGNLEEIRTDAIGQIQNILNQTGGLAGFFNDQLGTSFCGAGGLGGGSNSSSRSPNVPPQEADVNFFSQDIPGLGGATAAGAPSADALSAIQAAKSNVGLYNGSQNTSIPLYNLVANDLSQSISVSSSNNGLKVDEFGSELGQHWNLNAKDQISRVVKGYPDEADGDIIETRSMGFRKKGALRIQAPSGLGVNINKNIKDCTAPEVGFDDIWDEVEIARGSLAVIYYKLGWTPIELGEVNLTMAVNIPIIFGLKIGIELKFKGGYIMNDAFQEINMEDEVYGFNHPNTKAAFDIQSDEDFHLYLDGANDDADLDKLQAASTDIKKDRQNFYSPEIRKFNQFIGEIKRLLGNEVVREDVKYDTEPDEYHYSAGGYSGKFYYVNDKAISFPVHDGLIIEKIGNTFVITTPEGKVYSFGRETGEGIELMENVDYNLPNYYTYPELKINHEEFGDARLDMGQFKYLPVIGPPLAITYGNTWDRNFSVTKNIPYNATWHVTNVRSNLTGEELEYIYTNHSVNYFQNKSYQHTFPNFKATSDHFETNANPSLNPVRLIKSQWEGGKGNFSFSASECIHSKYLIKEIKSIKRHENIVFEYQSTDAGIYQDKMLENIKVFRGDQQHPPSLFKGWKFNYEKSNSENYETITSDCHGNVPDATGIEPNVTFSTDVEWDLGEIYKLKWNETAPFSGLRIQIFNCLPQFDIQIPIPSLRVDFGYTREMHQHGSLVSVKAKTDFLPFNLELEKDRYQSTFQRDFLSSIEGINQNNSTFDFVTNIEYFDGDLPPRFDLNQDLFGYYNDNSASLSPFPAIDYTPIFGSNSVKPTGHIEFSIKDVNSDMALGQNEAGDLDRSLIRALKKVTFASGGYYEYQYGLNEYMHPVDGLMSGAGLRVLSLEQNSIEGNSKKTFYQYYDPSYISFPKRIEQNPRDFYYRKWYTYLSNLSFPEILIDEFEHGSPNIGSELETKILVSSEFLNPIYQNGSNFVGYAHVDEILNNNGKIKHSFVTPDLLTIENCNKKVIVDGSDLGGGLSSNLDGCNQTITNTEELNLSYSGITNNQIHYQISRDFLLHGEYSRMFEDDILGMHTYLIGNEVGNEVYNQSGELLQTTSNTFEVAFDDCENELTFFKAKNFQFNYMGTYWDNKVMGFMRGHQPAGKWDNDFGRFILGALGKIIESQLPHPFLRIDKNFEYENYCYYPGQIYLLETSTTEHFGGDSRTTYTENTYRDDFKAAPKVTTVSNSVDNHMTVSESIFPDELPIDKYPAKEFLINANVWGPQYAKTRVNNVLVQERFTGLQTAVLDGIVKVIPFENYALINGLLKKTGEFDDFTPDGLPRIYRMLRFDEVAFPDINMFWDVRRQLLSRTYLDFTTTNIYNPFGQLWQTTDVNGIESRYLYDERARIKEYSTRNGKINTTYTYNIASGDNYTETEVSYSDAPTQTVTQYIDGFGKEIRSLRHDGTLLSSSNYDNMFRVISSFKIGGGPMTYVHDKSPVQRKSEVTDAENNTTISESGTGGFFAETKVTDPNQAIMLQETNSLGQLIQSTAALGAPEEATTNYKFDLLLRLGAVFNANNEMYRYSYNELGKPYKIETPGKSNPEYIAWDVGYRPVGTIDANGTMLAHLHDDYNRNTHVIQANIVTPGITALPMNYGIDPNAVNENDILFRKTFQSQKTWIQSTEDRILESMSAEFVTTDFTNDDFGRPIGLTSNFNGHILQQTDSYNDADLIINSDASFSSGFDFSQWNYYDDVLRLEGNWLSYNNGDFMRPFHLEYDEHDMIQTKLLGAIGNTTEFLQIVDYQYDEAVRLTQINAPGTSACFEEFCDFEATIPKTPAICYILGIVIDGTFFNFESPVVQTNFNEIENQIEIVFYQNGFYGEVEMVTSQGQWTNDIIISKLNADQVYLQSTCGNIYFDSGDCCGSNLPYSTASGSTNTDDLYYQEITYDGLDISSILIGSDCNAGLVQWDYTYDKQHRLKDANNSIFQFSDTYLDRYTGHYSYDKIGNMQALQRNGQLTSGDPTYGLIDDLEYTYSNSRLATVEDIGTQNIANQFDFKQSGSYTYDDNGNVTKTPTFSNIIYGINNQPLRLTKNGGGEIQNTYTFSGIRLQKEVIGGPEPEITEFAGPFELSDGDLKYFHHTVGRLLIDEGEYQYNIQDHLGNTVVTFADKDDDGEIDIDPNEDEVVQRNLYYPFGMVMEHLTNPILGDPENDYLYNGKELDRDHGLNWYNYGARYYDPAIARWNSVDPEAALMPAWSPYSYVFNNPLSFIDPDGRIPYPITIRSFAPFKTFGGGFHGDNRGFSTSSTATAKVHQRINFDTDKTQLKTNVWSSPTSHRFLPGSLTETPSVSIGGFSIADDGGSKTFNFDTHSKGANPMAPGSPNIDVFSNFSITESDGLLNISGDLKGDNFPSTEAFITDPNGNNVFIGIGFYEGSPFSSLGGENKRDITSFNFGITTDKSGNFTGVQYNGTDYSIGDWNKLFKQADPHKNE